MFSTCCVTECVLKNYHNLFAQVRVAMILNLSIFAQIFCYYRNGGLAEKWSVYFYLVRPTLKFGQNIFTNYAH